MPLPKENVSVGENETNAVQLCSCNCFLAKLVKNISYFTV